MKNKKISFAIMAMCMAVATCTGCGGETNQAEETSQIEDINQNEEAEQVQEQSQSDDTQETSQDSGRNDKNYAGVNNSTIAAYSGSEKLDDKFSDFAALEDGSYVVCGVTDAQEKEGYGNSFCIKFDKDGQQVWKYDIPNSMMASILQTEQGFLLIGSSISNEGVFENAVNSENGNAAAVFIDNEGQPVWGTQIGGTESDSFGTSFYTKTNAPVLMDNGNFLIAGTASSTDGDFEGKNLGDADGFIAELDSTDGKVVQIKSFGGTKSDNFKSLYKAKDGSYIVCGTTASTDGMFEEISDWTEGYTFVSKLDENLEITWTKVINTDGQSWGAGAAVLEDESILVSTGQAAGDFNTDEQSYITVVKYDKDGNELWNENYEAGSWNYVSSITATDNSTAVLVTESYDDDNNMLSLIGEIGEDGSLLWSELYATGNSVLSQGRKTADGTYVAAGYTVTKEGDYDSYLISYEPVTDASQVQAKPTEEEEKAEEDVSYKDGTYEGVARGLYSGLHVTVTIKDGKIDNVELGEHREDKPYVDNAAEGVIPAILEAQSTDVDTVSGATYSSKGIKAAVDYALEQATE